MRTMVSVSRFSNTRGGAKEKVGADLAPVLAAVSGDSGQVTQKPATSACA